MIGTLRELQKNGFRGLIETPSSTDNYSCDIADLKKKMSISLRVSGAEMELFHEKKPEGENLMTGPFNMGSRAQ
jgi:hypothetical protein